MIKNRISFEKLLSVLQGSAWAFAIMGAFYAFVLFSPFGFMIALLLSMLLFFIGFFFVIVLEIAQIQIEKLNELRKQTLLLEKLAEKQTHETLSDY